MALWMSFSLSVQNKVVPLQTKQKYKEIVHAQTLFEATIEGTDYPSFH